MECKFIILKNNGLSAKFIRKKYFKNHFKKTKNSTFKGFFETIFSTPDLNRQRKGLRSPKLACWKAITQLTREPI